MAENNKQTKQLDLGTSTDDCASSQLARPFPEPNRPAGTGKGVGGNWGRPPQGGDNYPGCEL